MRRAIGLIAMGVSFALATPAAASTRIVVPERFYDVTLDGDSIVYAAEGGRSDVVVRRHLTTGAREELVRTRNDINGLTLEPDGRIVFGVQSRRSSSVRELRTDGSVRVVARQRRGGCDGTVSFAGTGPEGVIYTMAESAPCTRRRITLVLREHALDGAVKELVRIRRRAGDDLGTFMFVLDRHLLTWDLFARVRVAPLGGGAATVFRDRGDIFRAPLDVTESGRLLVLVVRSLDRSGERVVVRVQLTQVGSETPGRTVESLRDQPAVGAFCGDRLVTWRRTRAGQLVRVLEPDGLTELSRQTGPGVPRTLPGFDCDDRRAIVTLERQRSTTVDVFDLS